MSYSPRPYLLTLALAAVMSGACAESPENADPEARNEQPRGDSGRPQDGDDDTDDDAAEDDDTPPASTPRDAGVVKRDASTTTPKPDSGSGTSTPPKDAGSSDSNPLDDLLGGIIDIFNPPKDAGADAGKRDGG